MSLVKRICKRAWLLFAILFSFLFLFCLSSFRTGQHGQDDVAIGFLIRDRNSVSALNGAALAVEHANRTGGYNGRKIKLAVRSMEGPWGTGSKQAVDLIFNEKVWAIAGSVDGRNSHLVEQACTKTNILFLSAWSSDPTLAQAYVPWFFNCVPDDIKQGKILAEEIYGNGKYRKPVIIHDSDYDSKSAVKFFTRESGKLTSEKISVPVIEHRPGDAEKEALEIILSGADCVVMFCNTASASEIISELKIKDARIAVYATHLIADENSLSLEKIEDSGMKIMIPLSFRSGVNSTEYISQYRSAYGKEPGLASALAYDAISLLVDALRNAGPERENVMNYLLKVSFRGVTGTIRFDELGGRYASGGLFEI